MKPRARVLSALIPLLGSLPVLACGHCDEDRAAAVYDHGVVTAARRNHHEMAFYSIEGMAAGLAKAPATVARALATVPEIDLSSVRISLEPAALSFSYNPRNAPRRVAAVVKAALEPLGLNLIALDVLNAPPTTLLK